MITTEKDAFNLRLTPARASTLASFLLLQGLGTAVSAQSSDSTETSAEDEDSKKRLEDVVVREQAVSLTSPKFTEPLLDTPKTVDVIPSRVIEQQGASSLRDVLRNSPGITFQAGEGGGSPGDNLYIRGFGARTDIFVDGVRDLGDFSRDAFNVEQVEVSKGPGSTYTGRGSTGGSVNMATKKAGANRFVHSNLEAGTADHYRGTVDVNQPLGEEANSAVRFNLMGEDSGVAGRDEVFNRKWGLATAYTYGLKSPTQISVNYQHLDQDNLPDYGLMDLATEDPKIDWSNFYGLTERDFEEISSDLIGLEVTHEISDDMSLRNYSRYGETSRDAGVTSPRLSQTNPDTMARRNDFKTQARDNKILANQTDLFYDFGSEGLHHSFLIGVELAREIYDNYDVDDQDVQGTETDLYNPTPNDPWGGTVSREDSYTRGTGRTFAGYLSDTLDIGEHWQVSGGLRFEHFDADTKDVVSGVEIPVYSRKDDMLSWRAGVVFKPTEIGSIYAGVGTSFNPSAEALTLSGSGRRGDPITGNPNFDPEENRSYELGTKWELLDRRLFLSAALFRTVKENALERDAAGSAVIAGDRTVDGIELGVSGYVTPQWYMYGGFVYMDTNVKSSLSGQEDVQLSYAPGESFNLWTTYDITDKLTVGGGAQYTGEYFYSNSNDESDIPSQASYWLLNGMVSYEINTHFTLRLNVDNLADEQYIERGYPAHFTPGPTRFATLTAELRF